MKKTVSILLVLILIIVVSTATAAGKISVTKENMHLVHNWYDYAYVFAKVENVGNKQISINAGIMEVFDGDGENITSSDDLNKYAQYLEPGEYTYVYMTGKLEEDQMELVDDYLLTLTGKSTSNYITKRYTVTDFEYQPNVKEGYYNYSYAVFTIVNDTEKAINDLSVVFALLDEGDNIIYVGNETILSSNKSLLPGSSIRVREQIDSDFIDYYEKNDITPAKIDVIVYTNIQNE